ncbi:MAG: Ala-tRNA(Pro) hydrolase [Hyphomicrobiales bacterium]|nr:MAG: Ala-tRNA(Pro) hydrolase [Hyphomicrobiales bacterium]
METALLFRDDAYLATCEAKVTGINEQGGILLDQTIFYATGGGQPGDTGNLERKNGDIVEIATTVFGSSKSEIVHVPVEHAPVPEIGETIICHLNWEKRFGIMRVHTALHLLSVVVPHPVSGGQIGHEAGRLDFDIPEATLDKFDLTEKLNALISGNHLIGSEWITDQELADNPTLVKTMSVKPPVGSGRVRLIRIGDVDLQPCGGTHVRETQEIGIVHIRKIEKKGKQNRRVRLSLGPAPTN